MATDLIRYDLLVQEALRGVVRNVLSEAARNGLQGEHHFFITFKTNAPGLRLSNRMRERYPDEMTIILQHQFWDLGVTDHAFEVGLSFSNVPERLLIPFAAVTSFVDPSVQFGLKFDVQDGSQQGSPATEPDAKLPAPEASKALPAKRTLAAVQSAEGQDAKAAVPAAAANAKPADRKPAKPTLAKVPEKAAEPKAAEGDGTKVVSIDAFRKKP
jgi:hypothetical protein